MAAIRPVVLVYQEYAAPTFTPSTPDLNCLVVGPAYHIQDYYTPGTTDYEDKSDILLSAAYGTLEDAVDAALPTGTDYITVAEPPHNVVGAVLDGDSLVVYFDEVRVVITGGAPSTTLGTTVAGSNVFVVTDAGIDFQTGNTKVLPGDRVILKDAAAHKLVFTVYAVDAAQSLRFTADVPSTGWTAGACGWRIERQLSDKLVDDSFFHSNGNTLGIDGSVVLAVTDQGDKFVSYAKVYTQYRALRQDLQELGTVSSDDEITTNIGRLDARNPLAVGLFVARQNTTARVQYVGVTTDDLVGYSAVRDAITPRQDVYAIVPLNNDPSIIAMWNADCVGLALPDEVRGRPQKFRVVLGSGTLTTTLTVVGPKTGAKPAVLTGTAPTTVCQITVPGATFIANGVIPTDKLAILLDSGGTPVNGNYVISAVISDTVLEIDGAFPSAKTLDVLATIGIKDATDTITRRAASVSSSASTTAAKAALFLTLQDDAGTFITDVLPGDVVQIPVALGSDFTGTLTSFVVASVLSENRLTVANNGRDLSTIQNELPHGVKRTGGALVPTDGTIYYRVNRTLSKDQQVEQLIALSQSFLSRRTVLVWPDKVDVAGVVGGGMQPGYYLSCAVGGMTSGLPPHQGFTFLGIAGISRIYDSNTYFKDDQLSDISNGGWFVFAQQTPSSLPFSIHQLTTDVTTLETGEYSVVKNFDFVSLYFVDILQDFLGTYNVTTDTITLIRSSLNIGGNALRLRSYAKIGAPLTSFGIISLGVSPTLADRLVARLSVGLPKPLNTIELHLVA